MNRTLISLGLFTVFSLLLQGIILYLMGQPPICTCGYVKLWEGVVLSSGNSQHIADWYTFSHVIHGILFYALLSWLFPRVSLLWRLALAVGIEAAWELVENTDVVINYYRQQALAQGYVGDSILNSVMDTAWMVVGFLLARRAPVVVTVGIAIFFEVFTGFMIRDNLFLNILGFAYTPEWIANWQLGK